MTDGGIPRRGRYVLVDAASARLFMIEDGHVRDSMRVIVGKPAAATPALKSVLNYATLNPHWNVPHDLAQTLIAPRVLKDGNAYLTDRGYEVVARFGVDAPVLAPDSVDWAAVAAGTTKVHARQRPGPANSMGQMKFNLVDVNGHLPPRHAEQGSVRQDRSQPQQRLRSPRGRAALRALAARQ